MRLVMRILPWSNGSVIRRKCFGMCPTFTTSHSNRNWPTNLLNLPLRTLYFSPIREPKAASWPSKWRANTGMTKAHPNGWRSSPLKDRSTDGPLPGLRRRGLKSLSKDLDRFYPASNNLAGGIMTHLRRRLTKRQPPSFSNLFRAKAASDHYQMPASRACENFVTNTAFF